MTRPLTHCSIDHVLRAWPFAPAFTDRAAYARWADEGPASFLDRLAAAQRFTRRDCTGWAGRTGVPLRLIVPLLELPTCPRCQVLWDLDQELRQETS